MTPHFVQHVSIFRDFGGARVRHDHDARRPSVSRAPLVKELRACSRRAQRAVLAAAPAARDSSPAELEGGVEPDREIAVLGDGRAVALEREVPPRAR